MIIVVIQARAGSTRLPGKVLRSLGGRPVLVWVVRAALAAGCADAVVVATTMQADDDAVASLAADAGAHVVRGPTDDVLSRFVVALDSFPAERVVRLTADCPLVDPHLIAGAVALHRDGAFDYVSTGLTQTLPRGLDVEVVSSAVLRTADAEATGADREHVTSFVYRSGDRFAMGGLSVWPDASDLRVTLDEEDDWRLLDELVQVLGDRPPSWREVVAALRERPELLALNRGVIQREIGE